MAPITLAKCWGFFFLSGDLTDFLTENGRVKDSVKVNVYSTGYGLFIAKEIVTAHKGTIWVESEGAGKGSTFIVELNVA